MLAAISVHGGENRRPTIICVAVDHALASYPDNRHFPANAQVARLRNWRRSNL